MRINGGIEYYGSRFLNLPWGWWWCYSDQHWYYYVGFEKHDPKEYVISDFEVYRRCLPLKTDTIFLSRRKNVND